VATARLLLRFIRFPENLLKGLGLLGIVSRGEPVRVRLDRQSKKRGHMIPITLGGVVDEAFEDWDEVLQFVVEGAGWEKDGDATHAAL
jgi:hypothetical protein